MKLEKNDKSFDDLFSDVVGRKEDKPNFIKDQDKSGNETRNISNTIKNTMKGVFYTVTEGIDFLIDMRNKDYKIPKEQSISILNAIKQYAIEPKMYILTIMGMNVSILLGILFPSTLGTLFLLIGLFCSIYILINTIKDILVIKKQVGLFKKELGKLPVVFKENKINFKLVMYQALARDNDNDFNKSLLQQIENVLDDSEWINLNKSIINLHMFKNKILEVEEKMKSFN